MIARPDKGKKKREQRDEIKRKRRDKKGCNVKASWAKKRNGNKN